ncbi:sigma-70 family RNA polymerase sigma factor [Olivibacter sp. SDN3]|uniref:Sigma-70 family RNA polymerase sigma factor n=1 Tax=Olivibacter jilunii TaxID=985016 RepID=A0ABW6B0H8_9SPHI|nr:sigma-70 family RNA polymerase sigma factor [Olivibacter sp. SDN3]MDX3917219.1 sigma-70 family RNA polymerase sigma factor [Pseudosphingobacterium sp.]QNL50245.1 sigma-70 family RNA polymerase sigma factor [Olivibacter sp. SDN3]
MNLVEAIQSIDLDAVIDRMNAYALNRLGSVGIKSFNGKEPVDFVGDVILKVIEGTRDWDNATCSFDDFLFGCLKSEISNFFKSNRVKYDDELPELMASNSEYDFEKKRLRLGELLKEAGADDEELTVFECWMDGMYKPAEISSDLGVEVKVIYNVTKRLQRTLSKIKSEAKNII